MCLFAVPVIEDTHLPKVILISYPSGGCVGKPQTILANACMAFIHFHFSRWSANIWAGAQLSPKPGGMSRLRRAHHCQANQSKPTESPCELPGSRLYGLGSPEWKERTLLRSCFPIMEAVRYRHNRNLEKTHILFQFLPSSPSKSF